MKDFSAIKNILNLSSGDIIGSVFSMIFWFYIAREISPSSYGEIHFFIGIASLTSYITTIGTSNTITVFTSKNNFIIHTLNSISLIFGGVGFVVLLLIFQQIDIGFLIMAFIINFIGIGITLGKKNYNKYSKLIISQKGLMLLLGFVFYYIFGEKAIIYAIALSYIPFLSIITEMSRLKIDLKQIKQNFKFIFENYSIQLLAGFGGQIDKLLVVPILGFAILGNYSLSLVIVNVLMILPNAVFKYLLPQEASGEVNNQLKVIIFGFTTLISIIGVISTPYILPNLFPQFTEVVELIQIMIFAIIPQSISVMYEAKLLAREKSRVVLTSQLIGVISLILGMIILGLTIGVFGLAISFIISVILKTIFLIFIYTKNKF